VNGECASCERIIMGLRYYISTNQGLRRVATKVILEEHGTVPQFAGTRQKIVEVVTERRSGELYFRATGSFAEFDEEGRFYISKSRMLSAHKLVQAYEAIEKERRNNPGFVDIGLRRKRKELRNKTQWEISAEEREAIVADLLGPDRPTGTAAIPLLKVEYP
jgi:hypothetical protein